MRRVLMQKKKTADVKAKFNLQFGNAMAAKIFKMKKI